MGGGGAGEGGRRGGRRVRSSGGEWNSMVAGGSKSSARAREEAQAVLRPRGPRYLHRKSILACYAGTYVQCKQADVNVLEPKAPDTAC